MLGPHQRTEKKKKNHWNIKVTMMLIVVGAFAVILEKRLGN